MKWWRVYRCLRWGICWSDPWTFRTVTKTVEVDGNVVQSRTKTIRNPEEQA